MHAHIVTPGAKQYMLAESGGEWFKKWFKKGAPHCRGEADMRRRGRVAPAVVIIMSHVATKPLVAVSTDPRKTKASELLTGYLEITKLINDNN